MNIGSKLAPALLAAILGSFGSIEHAQAQATPASASSSAELDAVTQLLDSWNGQGETLRQANEKLMAILAREPSNYRALKEKARYIVMRGYRNHRSVRYGSINYQVGAYMPGTLESAEAIIRQTIAINPKYAEGYVLLGYVLHEQTRVDEAAKALAQAESLGTSDPWLQLNWAAVLWAQGDRAGAEKRWRRVLEDGTATRKAYEAAYDALIEKLREAGEHDKAVALWEEQLRRNPNDAWGRGELGRYLVEEGGRYDDAIKYIRAALAIMNYPVGRQLLGKALYGKWAELAAQGREAEGEPYFREAQSIQPSLDNVMVYNASTPKGERLARTLIKKGVSIDARANDGSTALLLAVNRNFPDAVRFLLALNANPNIRDQRGWTPLLSAADEGKRDVVEMLLAKGADITATTNGVDAAAFAQKNGYNELAEMLRQRAGQSRKETASR